MDAKHNNPVSDISGQDIIIDNIIKIIETEPLDFKLFFKG